MYKLKNNMYKSRAKVLPPNSTDINEVHQCINATEINTTRN
jgi:hypothetical protein